jgi:hypothetical protein
MWDTMNGKVERKELEAVVARKVVDVLTKPCRIIERNDRLYRDTALSQMQLTYAGSIARSRQVYMNYRSRNWRL